jgi:abhydrolase domain-containing protein 6
MAFLKNVQNFVFKKLMSAARKSVAAQCKTEEMEFGEICYLEVNPSCKTETLVLLHGLGADKDTWIKMIKFLKDSYRIVVIDLPGHGDSVCDIESNYDINTQANCVIAFLQKLNLDHYHLLGHSMGGAIALKIAYLKPECVDSLTLISSYGVSGPESEVEKYEKENGYNPMLEIDTKADYKRMMKLAMFKVPYIPNFMIRVLAERAKDKAELYKSIWNQSKSKQNIEEQLSVVVTPTLIIWGEKDKVLNVKDANIFGKQLKNSKVFTIEETGHVPAVEQPKVIALKVSSFIESKMMKAS